MEYHNFSLHLKECKYLPDRHILKGVINSVADAAGPNCEIKTSFIWIYSHFAIWSNQTSSYNNSNGLETVWIRIKIMLTSFKGVLQPLMQGVQWSYAKNRAHLLP